MSATAPKRIRLSRAKGWRIPEGTINVARGPGRKWGNPFVVGQHGTRCQCVEWFALNLCGYMPLTVHDDLQLLQLYRTAAFAVADEMRGHDVACWCALDGKPCHGDVLLHLWNRAEGEVFNIERWQSAPLVGFDDPWAHQRMRL